MDMNEDQSIQEFVMNTFNKKPEEKRAQWIGLLNGQGYDTVAQLQEATQAAWNNLAKKLPTLVIDGLKKSLKVKSEKIDSKVVNVPPQNKINKDDDTKISSQELDKIIQFMNLDLPPQKIIKLLDARMGTLRGEAILQKIALLTKPPKPYPPNKQIPAQKTQDPMLPLFLYESKKIQGRKYYTFLVIGETGCGKTTLLDAFVNKLTGMEFTDNWRWKLVDQSYLDSVQSKKSKTSSINYYYVNDCLNIFNILIIDTPGFGDTRGLKVDNQITKLFQQFFREIQSIDFILLTIKSSDTRELGGSLYVYDRIQQLFGKNAEERFIIMCTFADDKTPKCLEVIKGIISYQKFFPFNNSALFTPSDKSTSMTKSYWKMGMNSIQQFSKYVQAKNVLPLSLTQSSEVLQLRNYLCQSIKTSQEQLVQSWRLLQISWKNLEQIKINKKKIEQNGSYMRKVPKTQLKRSPLKNYYQLCERCQVTCCQKCVWPPQATQSKCSYFYFNLFGCPKCPGRCPKSAHIRSNQLVIKVTVEVEEIVSYKKQLHDSGLSTAQYYVKLLKQSYEKVRILSKSVWQSTLKIKQDLKRLQQIALKPKIFTNQQFYKKMLEQEEQSKREGWVQRAQILKQIIKKIKFLGSVEKSLQMQDLFPGLQQLEVDYQKVVKGNNGNNNNNCQIF